jgi:hypothetical protein
MITKHTMAKSLLSTLVELARKLHYYRLTYHYHHFHCRSDKSIGVILPPSVVPIGRLPKDGNWQLKTINVAMVVWLNSTIIWNAEPTRIGVMATNPTRPFGVLAVVNSAWVISPFPNYPQHMIKKLPTTQLHHHYFPTEYCLVYPDAYINCSSLLLHLQDWPI